MPINPADQLGEPDFRYYNCNLQAPKMKCSKLDVDETTTGHLSPSGLCVDNGYKSLSTTHTFTSTDIPCLANSNASGELTLYFKNNKLERANVTLIIIRKTAGVIVDYGWYQRIGNMDAVDITAPSSTSIVATVSPAAEMRWFFRGV